MKEVSKRKSVMAKPVAPKKPSGEGIIRLDDLTAPKGVRGGVKTFFGSK